MLIGDGILKTAFSKGVVACTWMTPANFVKFRATIFSMSAIPYEICYLFKIIFLGKK